MNLYLREKFELKKLKAKSKKKVPKYYFIYFIVLICLAYIVDEIASNMTSLMQQEIIASYFPGDKGLSQYTVVITLCSAISVFTFIYKTLADRFGRKIFLVINTLGMAVGMLLCFISREPVVYILGLLITFFFSPCDIQVLYVMETSSDKHRAFWLSITKAVATMSIAITPLLRRWALSFQWQYVFLVPAIIGLVAGILCLLFINETEPFLKNRISTIQKARKERTMQLTKEEKKAQKMANSQGGIVVGIKYIFQRREFLWLFLVGIIFSICIVVTNNYSVIMNPNGGQGTILDEINNAFLVYPFMCAITEVLMGHISDKKGRRSAIICSGVICLIGLIYFVMSVTLKWSGYITGLFLGLFMGGYISGIDAYNIIIAEKSPTNMRSSVLSIMGIATSVGSFIGTGVLLLFDQIVENMNVGYFCLLFISPTLFIGLLALITKIPETRKSPVKVDKEKLLTRLEKDKSKEGMYTTSDTQTIDVTNFLIDDNKSLIEGDEDKDNKKRED